MTGADDDLRAAQALLEVGQHARAREAVLRYLSAYPDSARGLCVLSSCHHQVGEYTEMLTVARRAVAADPNEAWAWRLRSTAERALGWHRDALGSAQQAVRLQPLQWQGHVLVAEGLLAAPWSRTRAARRDAYLAASQAIAVAPQEPGTHLTLGRVYAVVGATGPARDCYHAALRLDPGHAAALNNLAVLDLRRGRVGRAGERVQDAIRNEPTRKLFADNAVAVAKNWGYHLLDLGSAALIGTVVIAVLVADPGLRALAGAAVVAGFATVGLLGLRRLTPGLRRLVLRRRLTLTLAASQLLAALVWALGGLSTAVILAGLPVVTAALPLTVFTLARLRNRAMVGGFRAVRGWWYQRMVFGPAQRGGPGTTGSDGIGVAAAGDHP